MWAINFVWINAKEKKSMPWEICVAVFPLLNALHLLLDQDSMLNENQSDNKISITVNTWNVWQFLKNSQCLLPVLLLVFCSKWHFWWLPLRYKSCMYYFCSILYLQFTFLRCCLFNFVSLMLGYWSETWSQKLKP